MKLNIKVSNFGKIKSADLQIRPFTVIAGKNSSGKSFVTKALYSFFSTINKDFVTAEAIKSVSAINARIGMVFYTVRLSIEEEQLISEMLHTCQDLHQMILQRYGENTFSNQLEGSVYLTKVTKSIRDSLQMVVNIMSPKKKYEKIRLDVDGIAFELKHLDQIFEKPVSLMVSKIQKEFTESLKENFQMTSLASLRNFECPAEKNPEFEIEAIGTISIEGETVNFSLQRDGIDLLQDFSSIVYLESPIYWRLKNTLERAKDASKINFIMRHKKQDGLLGVPRHFYDLVDLLKERLKTNLRSNDFKDVIDKINTSIGGEVLITQSGDISYREKSSGNELNLHTTATGVVNLGIISLLIERNIISRGSYIFIDEPEVNLHPAWQKLMVEALYELSRNGINIVIATHSIDMMKCIEGIVNSLPPEKVVDHFGINQLSSEGNSVDIGEYPPKRIASIKYDLGESFYNMQMDGGW